MSFPRPSGLRALALAVALAPASGAVGQCPGANVGSAQPSTYTNTIYSFSFPVTVPVRTRITGVELYAHFNRPSGRLLGAARAHRANPQTGQPPGSSGQSR